MVYRRHGLVVLECSAPAWAWHAAWVQMGAERRRGAGVMRSCRNLPFGLLKAAQTIGQTSTKQ